MQIGIFWFYRNQVLGIAHDFDTAQADSLGLIDSPFTHIDYWPTIQARLPELAATEYEHLPRGRVIYDKNRDKFVVYLDETLYFQQPARKICDFFQAGAEADKVMFKKDPHYQI